MHQCGGVVKQLCDFDFSDTIRIEKSAQRDSGLSLVVGRRLQLNEHSRYLHSQGVNILASQAYEQRSASLAHVGWGWTQPYQRGC